MRQNGVVLLAVGSDQKVSCVCVFFCGFKKNPMRRVIGFLVLGFCVTVAMVLDEGDGAAVRNHQRKEKETQVGYGTTDVVLLAGVINKIKELVASIKGKTLVEKSNASNMETERCQPKRSHMGDLSEYEVIRIVPDLEMAWQSIVSSLEVTKVNKYQIVETEHLLKGILEEKNGLAQGIFSKADVD
ncbi:chaperone protein ClpB3, chloroplastic isoform X1 [Tanacetum coccineum]|uniref:Chaperone protein ClpB3, chloroplastic isoform X1 n=1 Tax=Tanacetum coccineum TaxID=301880 RepID=A0ABQ5CMU2_9ASTR